MNDNPNAHPGADRSALPVASARGRPPDTYLREPQGYGPYGDEDTQSLDIFKYLRIVIKHKWLIAGITLLFFVVTAVSTFMMTPIYRATASIQIEHGSHEAQRKRRGRGAEHGLL